MPIYYRPQICPLFRDRMMHPASQLRLYLVELMLKLFVDCFATNRKLALSCYSTDVGKSKKVERVRFTFATAGSVLGVRNVRIQSGVFCPYARPNQTGQTSLLAHQGISLLRCDVETLQQSHRQNARQLHRRKHVASSIGEPIDRIHNADSAGEGTPPFNPRS